MPHSKPFHAMPPSSGPVRERRISTSAPKGFASASSRRTPRSSTTSTTSPCSRRAQRRRRRSTARSASRRPRRGRRARRAWRSGARTSSSTPGSRPCRRSRCSTTSPCSSTLRTSTSPPRTTSASRSTTSSTPRTPTRCSSGDRSACASSTSSTSRRSRSPSAPVLVAGAGMAGLVCAARARELGLRPRLIDKGTRPGGSMLLSSCVIWRHRDWEQFRLECPGGDETVQRLVYDRLDDALDWLVSLGAEAVWEDTENPLTTGKRFDPPALTQLLARDVELETPLPSDPEPPVVLATGGFGKRLAAERGLLLRANPWSDGAGLDFALARGAEVTAGMDEFYGRAMPAPPARIREEDFVRLSQLYGKWAWVHTHDGRVITPPSVSWSENDLAQLIGPSAWYVLNDEGYAHARDRVEAARAAG